MKIGLGIGVACAVFLHVGFILFGGWFFLKEDDDHGTLQQVELLTDDEVTKEEEEEPEPTIAEDVAPSEPNDEQEAEATDVVRSLDAEDSMDAPALEAASLSAIEAALSGQSGRGEFAQALDFASGGRIGGKGQVGAIGGVSDEAFEIDEVDQAPRLVVQVQPIYPSDMRGKKVEGLVQIAFVVDAEGRVSNPRVEQSSHASFVKPALDAIKKWKFEPALRDGKRVPKKMRVPIRFPIPS